jgi:hypothetical protein
MQKEKGISTLIGIIIIVVAALVLFGGVFAYQYFVKSQIPNPNDQSNLNSQNSNTEIADWKTYTNSEYGFEIKYPDEWGPPQEGTKNDFLTFGKQGIFIELHNYDYVFENFVNSEFQNKKSKTVKSAIDDFNVSNLKGKKIKYYYDDQTDIYVYLPFSKYVAIVFSDAAITTQENIFDKIISTFKFTK